MVEARQELTWWSLAAKNYNAAPIVIPLVIETDIAGGVGSKMSGPKDRRSLVSEGTGIAHQCLRADSSSPSNLDFHKREEASTHSGEKTIYYSQVLQPSPTSTILGGLTLQLSMQ